MDMEKARELRAKTEKELGDRIVAFEVATGLLVERVELHRAQEIGSPRGGRLIQVELDTKLG